ncbi:Transcription repressor OFP7 [Camellia lanceoleosa]|uniref:Transcription repressor OFP7 n=1 Tax=Camellia lanceoleosa TaxID=1840588 RepID=A0ACC0GIE9_9ERIC|nr:Transcription repressor OFP7 [Camellia lanceoleosa]
MAFKAFFSRIISSFKFCCSKNLSNIPENPIQLSPKPLFIDCPPANPCFSFKHHVSSIFGCGFCTHEDDLPESPACKWDETPRHDYNSSIFGDFDDELFPSPPPPTRHPITTSSADSGLCGYERDDEEEEIMTLASFSLNRKKRMKKLLPSFPAEGKVKDNFAVVKESVDPYEDFKASMMEMILAK